MARRLRAGIRPRPVGRRPAVNARWGDAPAWRREPPPGGETPAARRRDASDPGGERPRTPVARRPVTPGGETPRPVARRLRLVGRRPREPPVARRLPRWGDPRPVARPRLVGRPPVGRLPAARPPGGETPGGNTPGGETPGGETPGGNTPGGETPGGETPGGETPGGESPGGESPGEQGGEQGEVLPESEAGEEVPGGGGTTAPTGGVAGTVTEATTTASLPFTGSHAPLLLVVAVGLLGLGTGLRRVAADRAVEQASSPREQIDSTAEPRSSHGRGVAFAFRGR